MDGEVDCFEKHGVLGVVVLDILVVSFATCRSSEAHTLGVSCEISMMACKIPFSISIVDGFSAK